MWVVESSVEPSTRRWAIGMAPSADTVRISTSCFRVPAVVPREATLGNRWAHARPGCSRGIPIGAIEGDRRGVVMELGDVDRKAPDHPQAERREQARPVGQEQLVEGAAHLVVVQAGGLARLQSEQLQRVALRPARCRRGAGGRGRDCVRAPRSPVPVRSHNVGRALAGRRPPARRSPGARAPRRRPARPRPPGG